MTKTETRGKGGSEIEGALQLGGDYMGKVTKAGQSPSNIRLAGL